MLSLNLSRGHEARVGRVERVQERAQISFPGMRLVANTHSQPSVTPHFTQEMHEAGARCNRCDH
jgi:hypothetical protein